MQDFALAMVKYWLDKGVDGFRLDTVNYYFHDKKLRDNPPSPKQFKHPPTNPYYAQDQRYSINQKGNLNPLKSFRSYLIRMKIKHLWVKLETHITYRDHETLHKDLDYIWHIALNY